MSSSHALYTRLHATLSPIVTVSHRKHLTNWLWIVVGLLLGQSPALSQIAHYLPMAPAAESRVTLIRRWLQNSQIDVWAVYEPVLQHVVRDWLLGTAYLILEGVMLLGDRWQLFRVALQHGCRAMPLTWVVVPGKGVTQVERLTVMLTRVALLLRQRVKQVIFLADRGFRDWAQLCEQ